MAVGLGTLSHTVRTVRLEKRGREAKGATIELIELASHGVYTQREEIWGGKTPKGTKF